MPSSCLAAYILSSSPVLLPILVECCQAGECAHKIRSTYTLWWVHRPSQTYIHMKNWPIDMTRRAHSSRQLYCTCFSTFWQGHPYILQHFNGNVFTPFIIRNHSTKRDHIMWQTFRYLVTVHCSRIIATLYIVG